MRRACTRRTANVYPGLDILRCHDEDADWTLGQQPAVRLPKALVERLGLKEGDEIDLGGIEKAAEQSVRARREAAIAKIKARAWKPDDGWKFDRDQLYDELLDERLGKHKG